MEVFTQSIAAKDYKSMCCEVLDKGKESDYTKFLKNRSILLDRSSVKFDEILLPKYRAGGKKTSPKYALAELLWYASGRTDTELIEKFGPIWLSMQDEHGNVNSNYGHQIMKNQNFEEKIKELVETNSTTFFIASHENQFSRNDLVCNNAVKLTLTNDQTNLDMTVFARSIDLVYGYPYDLFAAQIFGAIVINELMSNNLLDLTPSFNSVRFDIQNVHIYHKDIDSSTRVELEMMDQKSYYKLSLDDEIINEIKTARSRDLNLEDVEQFRDKYSDRFSEISIDNFKVNQVAEFQMFRVDDKNSIFRVLSRFYGMRSAVTRKRVESILSYLNADKFDRKNLVVENGRLAYISLLWNGYKTVYEVSVYEL